jgi:hypothetical protein
MGRELTLILMSIDSLHKNEKKKKTLLNPNPKPWLAIWLMGRELTLILMSIDSTSSK